MKNTYAPDAETVDKLKKIGSEFADQFKELFGVIKEEYYGDTYHAKPEDTKPLIMAQINSVNGGKPTQEDLETFRTMFEDHMDQAFIRSTSNSIQESMAGNFTPPPMYMATGPDAPIYMATGPGAPINDEWTEAHKGWCNMYGFTVGPSYMDINTHGWTGAFAMYKEPQTINDKTTIIGQSNNANNSVFDMNGLFDSIQKDGYIDFQVYSIPIVIEPLIINGNIRTGSQQDRVGAMEQAKQYMQTQQQGQKSEQTDAIAAAPAPVIFTERAGATKLIDKADEMKEKRDKARQQALEKRVDAALTDTAWSLAGLQEITAELNKDLGHTSNNDMFGTMKQALETLTQYAKELENQDINNKDQTTIDLLSTPEGRKSLATQQATTNEAPQTKQAETTVEPTKSDDSSIAPLVIGAIALLGGLVGAISKPKQPREIVRVLPPKNMATTNIVEDVQTKEMVGG